MALDGDFLEFRLKSMSYENLLAAVAFLDARNADACSARYEPQAVGLLRLFLWNGCPVGHGPFGKIVKQPMSETSSGPKALASKMLRFSSGMAVLAVLLWAGGRLAGVLAPSIPGAIAGMVLLLILLQCFGAPAGTHHGSSRQHAPGLKHSDAVLHPLGGGRDGAVSGFACRLAPVRDRQHCWCGRDLGRHRADPEMAAETTGQRLCSMTDSPP